LNHVVGSVDGYTGEGQLYINGEIQNLDEDYNFERSTSIVNFVKYTLEIGIGDIVSNRNESLNGSIDELAIYTKVLSSEEIAQLYKTGKAEIIDYKDSLHGKGIEFDGVDDYVSINHSDFINGGSFSEFSFEFWIKLNDYQSKASILNFKEISSSSNNLFLAIENNKTSGKIYFESTHGTLNKQVSNYNFNLSKNYHIVFDFNGTTKKTYINSKLINSTTENNPFTYLPSEIYLGADNDEIIGINEFFNGIIDEVKIYNRSLSKEEIKSNYYNYKGSSKGCCNYLTLMNTNDFGFNDTKRNVSSTTYMYNKFLNGEVYNVTLWNMTNITSNVNMNYHYNFLVDICLMQALSLPYGNTTTPGLVNVGEYNNSCSNLIKKGIY